MQEGCVSHFSPSRRVFFNLLTNLDAKPLVQKQIDALAPDPHARTNAINFLLAAVCGVYIPIYSC